MPPKILGHASDASRRPRRSSSTNQILVVTCALPRRGSLDNADENEEFFRSLMDSIGTPRASNSGPEDLPSVSFPSMPAGRNDHSSPISRLSQWSISDTSFGVDLLLLGPYNRVKQVWAILFGSGERGKEGIYSLRRSPHGDDSLPQEIIITFESEEDAIRYAALLEATMDHSPQVSLVQVPDLCRFCDEHGYQCRMEPAGCLLIPPTFNVTDTDWERSERLRNGLWSVMQTEPDMQVNRQPDNLAGAATLSRNSASMWGASDLDTIRAQLEKLLSAE
eukprot:gene12856-3570_t